MPLMLSRKLGQSIVINDCIAVKVVGVNRGSFKIAVTAPAGMAVYREEVWDEIKRSQRGGSLVGGRVCLADRK